MNYQNSEDIDISSIRTEARYLFTVEYIFPTPFSTVATFEKKDYETGFHVQEFYEICIISKGSGFHIIEDTCVKAIKGDVFIVPPGRKHAFIGGEGFNVFYIHLSPFFLERYTPKMKSLPGFYALFEIEPMMRASGARYRHLYLENDVMTELLALLTEASPKHQHDAPSTLILESYIVIALSVLCREYDKLQTKIGKNANNDKLFMDSIAMIYDRYSEKITIEGLAKIAKMSRTAYIKRFTETVGTSPRSFITAQRIKAAKNLLVCTNHPVANIAESTGFYDSAHFSKCFAAAVGMSPTEYRKKK